MKNFYLAFLLSVWMFVIDVEARIIEAPNLTSFEKELGEVNQDTFVLFDVDETLFTPKDLILNPYVRRSWNSYAKETIKNPEIVGLRHAQDGDHFFGQVLSTIEYKVVDLKLVEIISSLQQKNIKTIAFTKMRTGTIGVIHSMEDWRLGHLKRHQFDFSQAFPQYQEMQIEVQGSTPAALFKNGLLCANGQDKGPVLVAFLAKINWKPAKILFLDDRLDYLESVEASLKGTGIEFIGFHYRQAESFPRTVNEDLAKFQLMHLAKTGVWLGDQEASTRLWKIGAKIHFEEEDGVDYIGTKQLHATTKQLIKEIITTVSDDCAENAKIFLKREENGEIRLTHYEEASKPGIGEELHATLLYTRPRGFCDSETLAQNCSRLFSSCNTPPSIEQVAKVYSSIIQPEWNFEIAEIALGNREKGPFCLVAKLLFEGKERIFKGDKAISAGLHLTLVNFADKSIFTDAALDELIKKLNEEFQGKQIKVAEKNGIADLEFGISGCSWRLRAEQ